MKNILDTQVSIFQNYSSPDNPREVNLLTWLHSKKYAAQVEAIRATDDKAERDRLKAQLPAITASGTFTRREEAGLVKHSGLVQIDIDLKENNHITNFTELKQQICRLPEIAYLGLSVSGRGFWGLVPLAYPERHKEQFTALRQDFAKWGIVLDDKPGNVASLRGYSFDSEAYFNPQAKAYRKVWRPKPEPYQGRNSQHWPKGSETEKVEVCLARIEATRIDIAQSYGEWFSIGCALASEFGEQGRGYFHRASQFYHNYSQAEADKQFTHCLKSRRAGYTIATFYQLCQDYGITYREAFQSAPESAQTASSPARMTTAQTKALPQQEIKPQEAPIQPEGATVAQPEETLQEAQLEAPGGKLPAPGQLGDELPEGFAIIEGPGGRLLEVDGLPMEWLNEEELKAAQERIKGFEIVIASQLNPVVGELVERFGLEVEFY